MGADLLTPAAREGGGGVAGVTRGDSAEPHIGLVRSPDPSTRTKTRTTPPSPPTVQTGKGRVQITNKHQFKVSDWCPTNQKNSDQRPKPEDPGPTGAF